ncbi:MAG TPA: DNA polymerase III subunit delta' [Acetivibrio sp.]|uniref:DNA polymerase III subunit delta' n=1 Tax=Acetivibrio sp. TaxID=1872092 RepID=UPI002BC61D68|nr:DNA polymerase III subunit delta' [Acetivibrio sp.]HOM02505.1 DNA polymerase III subunit delta' [Acetivibrio sp.]
MDFNAIIGQKDVVEGLKTLINNDKIGHAYIFYGPEGIGKSTVAKIFASVLMCSDNTGDKSCGSCQSCRLFENGTNPDFSVLECKGLSIGVEEIRNLQHDICVRPLYSKRKVYLIRQAEKMTPQAQNCLLKTLEEPPEYAVIILAASNYEALLETIRSRSVRIDFKKNTFDEVKRFIINRAGGDFEQADFIASYADGVIGRAIKLMESEEFKELREKAIDAVIKLSGSDFENLLDISRMFDENKDSVDSILDIMLLFYRDLLVVGKYGNEKLLINSDKKDIILKNTGKFSVGKLLKNIDIIEKTRNNLEQNANYQLAIEVMLMKLQEENA